MVWRLRSVLARPLATAFQPRPSSSSPSGVCQTPIGARSYRARTARHLRNRPYRRPPVQPSPCGKDRPGLPAIKGHDAARRVRGPGRSDMLLTNTPRPAKVGQLRHPVADGPLAHPIAWGTHALDALCRSIFFPKLNCKAPPFFIFGFELAFSGFDFL